MGRRHRVACVVWDDAHGGLNGWGSFEAKKDHKPRVILSVGIVLRDDEVGITLAQSKDQRARNYDNTIFVPRVCITEVTDVTPSR